MGIVAWCEHLYIHGHDRFRVLESSHSFKTNIENMHLSGILWVSLRWASKPAEIQENPTMWKETTFCIDTPKVFSPH